MQTLFEITLKLSNDIIYPRYVKSLDRPNLAITGSSTRKSSTKVQLGRGSNGKRKNESVKNHKPEWKPKTHKRVGNIGKTISICLGTM